MVRAWITACDKKGTMKQRTVDILAIASLTVLVMCVLASWLNFLHVLNLENQLHEEEKADAFVKGQLYATSNCLYQVTNTTRAAEQSYESRYGAANVELPADRVAEAVIQLDEQRQVTECLDSLTDAQRECIQLAYYEGLTYVQVSDRLTANLATIKSRMRDAIRGLRNCLGVS